MPWLADFARSERLIARRDLLIGFLLLIGGALVTSWLVVDSRRRSDLVAHTIEVRGESTRLLAFIQGAETSQRGFLLTRDPQYLSEYGASVANSQPRLDGLKRLTADNPSQQHRLAVLQGLLTAKLGELAYTVALGQAGQFDAAIARVRTARGKHLMDQISEELRQIQAEEGRLLAIRTNAADTTNLFAVILSIGVTGLAGVLGASAIRDLGQRNRDLESAQAILRTTNENLELTVTRRTADLTEANAEIQRFAYIVSHDLRSPLVNIMGFTAEIERGVGVMRDQIDAIEAASPALLVAEARTVAVEELPEAIGFIRASTERMDRLIAAILKLSRTGHRTLQPEAVDMTAAVTSIADGMIQQAMARGAEVLVAPLPALVVDRTAIDQIFGNLLDNAVKYLDDSRPGRITVTGAIERDDPSHAVYRVTDNGRGISVQDRERVFELFRRAGRQDQPGEGIGLAHVRTLVRSLGGSVGLTSEVGKGSTFILRLPLRPTVLTPTANSSEPT